MVGAADPFQLFRIMYEVVRGGGYGPDTGVAFMLDQCHNIEPKIPGQIRSVHERPGGHRQGPARRRRRAGRGAGAPATCSAANAVLMDAYNTDVRPLLADWRDERGLRRRPDGRVPGLAGTPSRSSPSASAAPRPGGAPDRHELTTEHVATSCSPGPHRLGADPRNTNYAGGNTSAKGTADRPGHRRATSTCCGSRAPAATSAP